jgi:hypothetical protein
MTHPRRIANAVSVVRSQPDLDIRIVEDPAPDNPPGAVRTALRAWESMPDASTHHMVLQDDVQATAGLSRHVTDAVAQLPGRPLCLFTEWASRTAQNARLAVLEGYGLVEVVDRLHTTQGVILPAVIAREFTSFVRGSGVDIDTGVADADLLFGFLRSAGHTVYMTAPNLVEHIELPSLLANDVLRGPRQSPCFDAELTPRHWAVQPVGGPSVVPHMSTDGRSYCHSRRGGCWETEHTLGWLEDRGLSTAYLKHAFHAEMALLPEVVSVRTVVSDAIVFQLWLTALASGHVMREQRGVDSARLGRALAEPAAGLAWSTLVPGALRKTFPLEVSRKLGLALRPMLDRALLGQGRGDAIPVSGRADLDA